MVRPFMLLLLLLLPLGAGCSICQSCFDQAYPYYGSTAERTNRFHGRVGSRFAPASAEVGKTSPYVRETELADLENPEPDKPAAEEKKPEGPATEPAI